MALGTSISSALLYSILFFYIGLEEEGEGETLLKRNNSLGCSSQPLSMHAVIVSIVLCHMRFSGGFFIQQHLTFRRSVVFKGLNMMERFKLAL